jgi:endogenous inhibitor of DNA gyrase (YacG/DUF329 family)
MCTIILHVKCPCCKNTVELNADGRKRCSSCNYEIDMNRYN